MTFRLDDLSDNVRNEMLVRASIQGLFPNEIMLGNVGGAEIKTTCLEYNYFIEIARELFPKSIMTCWDFYKRNPGNVDTILFDISKGSLPFFGRLSNEPGSVYSKLARELELRKDDGVLEKLDKLTYRGLRNSALDMGLLALPQEIDHELRLDSKSTKGGLEYFEFSLLDPHSWMYSDPDCPRITCETIHDLRMEDVPKLDYKSS
ncbi:hypothetical protein K8R33_03645 [archaeon]|nr:hypothetical protein [archaeon]